MGFGGTLNDDDNDDLLIGAWKDDGGASNAGAAYVLFGPVSGSIGLSDADARLTGGGGSDQAGTSLMGGRMSTMMAWTMSLVVGMPMRLAPTRALPI